MRTYGNPNCKIQGYSSKRPKLYGPRIVQKIIQRILEGRTVKSICAERGMPNRITFAKWLHKYPDFAELYYKTKMLQAQINVDGIMEVAMAADEKSASSVMKAKLVVDTMKWESAKMLPRIYGERASLEISNEKAVTADQLEEIMATALAKVAGPEQPALPEVTVEGEEME